MQADIPPIADKTPSLNGINLFCDVHMMSNLYLKLCLIVGSWLFLWVEGKV